MQIMPLHTKYLSAALALAAAATLALACGAHAAATADELGVASQAQHEAWLQEMRSEQLGAGAGRQLRQLDLNTIKENNKLPVKIDIGIITAWAPEVQAVLSKMDSILGKKSYSGRAFFIGKLKGKTVAVTTSGESMVNAALTTQLFVDKFSVSKLIFSGIAGGINPANNIGDVVIPAKWAQPHNQRYIRPLKDTKFFYYEGSGWSINAFVKSDNGSYLSYTRPACTQCGSGLTSAEAKKYRASGALTTGFALPINVQVLPKPGDIFASSPPSTFFIPVDPGLLAVAKKVAGSVKLSSSYTVPGTNTTFTLAVAPKIKVGGNGMSSATFVDNAEYRLQLYASMKAECCDMESTAFMQVCATNQKACIVIRSLSDLAGGDDEGNQVGNFFGMASAHSSAVLAALVSAA